MKVISTLFRLLMWKHIILTFASRKDNNKMNILLIGFIIWIIGAVVAWFQIKHWNKDNELIYPRDYIVLSILCLLSWMIYPISILEDNNNRLDMK